MSASSEEEKQTKASRLRLPFVGLGCGLGLLIAAAALVLYFRDPIPIVTADDLAAAQQRWQAQRPANYDLDLEISGLRPGKVHVEVREGKVTAMTRDGKTPSQQRTWQVWTVDGQLETIEREFELASDPVGQMNLPPGTRVLLHGQFDPKYGYPQRFRRLIMGGQGPEMSWRTTRFHSVDVTEPITDNQRP